MRTDDSRLTWALILSVLLHGLILTLLPLARQARLALPQPPRMIDVDLAAIPKVVVPKAAPPRPAPQAAPMPGQPVPPPPAIPVPKQQIVSPPDRGEEKEPANARFLSDRNNVVKEEMVRRGDPAAGDPEGKGMATKKEQADAAKPNAPAANAEDKKTRENSGRKPAELARSETQVAALPKLDQLLPPTGEMLRDGGLPQEAEPAAPAPQQHAKVERNDLLRHGDPWRTNGLGGTRDFLPAVRDGDVTMLNTKADQFAPFVRRVAVRVFQNFVMLVRRSRDTGRESTEEFATVEAVMDKTGRVISIETKRRSGSVALATDRNLHAACREGFFDRNPPSGAEASDGNIHFVFDARITVVQDGAGHRVPNWVMMGAGLL
ncbi:MAG: hypothetical protein H6Q33_3719 [Deltaproteobacteria bacterium]|nr:hypothetical protein [Deltaproteobacteria bacterium]